MSAAASNPESARQALTSAVASNVILGSADFHIFQEGSGHSTLQDFGF